MAFHLPALAEALAEDMQLSPFGQLLTELCARQGVTKVELAKAVEALAIRKRGRPLSSGYMTDCLRDPRHKRAYAPDPDFLPIWADMLSLKPESEERAAFMDAGLQAKLREGLVRSQFDNMAEALKEKDRQNESLAEKNRRIVAAAYRLGSCTDQLIRLLRERGVEIPKALKQELKAAEDEIGADV